MAKKSSSTAASLTPAADPVILTPETTSDPITPVSTPATDAAAEQKPEPATEPKAAPELATIPVAEAKVTPSKTTVTKKATSATAKTMEELLAQNEKTFFVPKKGVLVTGVVTGKNRKQLLVDIGSKTEGVVTEKEFDMALDYITELKVGDKVEAIVFSTENEKGQVLLSLKQAALDAKWQYFLDALNNDTVLIAKGIEVNKGGLIVVVNGVRGFVPSSQFGKQFLGNINKLRNQDLKVKAIEVDREKNRLIFSERHVSEEKEMAQRSEALQAVKSGEVYEGVVSGVMHFGLFVTVEVPVVSLKKSVAATKTTATAPDVTAEDAAAEVAPEAKDNDSFGHVEGLVHISEISWEKVNNPKDYHKVGDRIKVKVLGVDENTHKLNLSIKQLSDDPWTGIADRYPIGTTFEGTVSRVESFGVFVNVEAGVDGLIHSSKLTPDVTYKRGDKVTVTVENVDSHQRRMSLSVVLTEVPMGYK